MGRHKKTEADVPADPARPFMNETPVRDLHGNELPTEGTTTLSVEQVEQGLEALPGWSREGSDLVRRVPVPADSRDGLREGVRNVVSAQSRLGFDDEAEELAIRLGRDARGLRPDDLETAARIDTVLSGSGRDTGDL